MTFEPLDRREAALFAAVRESPGNDDARLIYADWLEEQGDARAEYLRLERQWNRLPWSGRAGSPIRARLVELTHRLPLEWIAAVARANIAGCPDEYIDLCPRAWEALPDGDHSRERRCPACRQLVIYCRSVAEAVRYTARNVRVAVDPTLPRNLADLSSSGNRSTQG